jgi:hypothetical protein
MLMAPEATTYVGFLRTIDNMIKIIGLPLLNVTAITVQFQKT